MTLKASSYPRADFRTQNFSRAFPGSPITPNVLVLHTTETGTWPAYAGGATAPTLTAKVDPPNRRLLWRQHFPLTMSARALRNESGGVETNTLNAVQVELIGTCTTAYRDRYGYFFWPAAPDWVLQELAKFVTWLHEEWPAFPIKDAAPRGWLPYPSSYGNSNGQRLSMTEWRKAYGILGHQHVPENSHGDPGNLKAARLVQFALPDEPNPTDKGEDDQPDPSRIQQARALLRQARLQAVDKGNERRARKIREGLQSLPKS